VSPGNASARLAVIGLAGAGKSTCAGFIEEFAAARRLTHARVKLATPLYELQEQVYGATGRALSPGVQDQVLMEALAQQLRRINSRSLVDNFLRRLAQAHVDVVLTDDLRDPHVDAPALQGCGFKILRIVCDEPIRRDRLARRGDPTLTDGSTAELHLIRPDAVIDSGCGIRCYRDRIEDVLLRWL